MGKPSSREGKLPWLQARRLRMASATRRRRRKQNKLFSIKYQSYHRHHLIRISSCHILQRAKKTKKTKFSSKKKVIEKIIEIHPSTIPSRKKKANYAKKKCPIVACIQFFW